MKIEKTLGHYSGVIAINNVIMPNDLRITDMIEILDEAKAIEKNPYLVHMIALFRIYPSLKAHLEIAYLLGIGCSATFLVSGGEIIITRMSENLLKCGSIDTHKIESHYELIRV